MSLESLIPPRDITWTRLAFSRDMIDTNFGDQAFSPKWRSSLAVYYYVVPEEEVADEYPNSRIVYLKLTCSITGWNPSETLRDVVSRESEAGTWDDLQRTLWETIVASGWASSYWPCLGAIMQIAVYPNNADGIAPDDYPYILDFEPKKRELFEAVTEGSEQLSASSDRMSLTKGSTTVTGSEYGGSAGFSVGGFGASASYKETRSDTVVHQNQTDTSREARETLSRTTSTSQMYQLFNGYHLGTNRALFVVAPRPHTVSASGQTGFNLLEGERKLEGIQDVFLVVHLPKALDGFCIQAGLDTGHQAPAAPPQYMAARRLDDDGDWPDPPIEDPDPPPPDPPTTPTKQIVVTRRVVQSCGTFDENGNFVLRHLREPRNLGEVVGEFGVSDRAYRARAAFRAVAGSNDRQRYAAVDAMNAQQARINRLMLDTASAGNGTPRRFEETSAFKALAAAAARRAEVPVSELADRGYICAETAKALAKSKIHTLGDLFNQALDRSELDEARKVRAALVDDLFKLSKA